MKMPKVDWQQSVVIVALIAGAAAICVFAPSELHAPLAAIITAAAGWLRSPKMPSDSES